MNRSLWYSNPGSALLARLVVLAVLPAAAAQTYRIQELPPPDPSGNSFGFGINDAGVVVGQALTLSGYYRAVQWVDGSPSDLGWLPDQEGSFAQGISGDNKIVGRSQTATPCVSGSDPFLWQSGEMGPLPDPPRLLADPYKINDASVAVGEAYDSCEAPYNNAAYQWQYLDGNWTFALLPPLPAHPEAGAYDVNNSGLVVGFSGTSADLGHFHACRWIDGLAAALPDLGGSHSIAFGVNEFGQCAGYSRTQTGTFRAYYFDGTSAVDLGTLPGYPYSAATRLNNAGTVIGHAFTGETFWPYPVPNADQRAFVWRDGLMRDVNDLIAPGSGWIVNGLWDINESGQMTGHGQLNDLWRACLITPCWGDLDNDRSVGLADLAILLAHFGIAGSASYADGDLDANGDVSLSDLATLLANFGTTCL